MDNASGRPPAVEDCLLCRHGSCWPSAAAGLPVCTIELSAAQLRRAPTVWASLLLVCSAVKGAHSWVGSTRTLRAQCVWVGFCLGFGLFQDCGAESMLECSAALRVRHGKTPSNWCEAPRGCCWLYGRVFVCDGPSARLK